MGSEQEDRYLQKRDKGGYRYVRRVPKNVRQVFGAVWVRKSLNTHDAAVARARRDILEKAHDEYWSALIAGPNDAARRLYEAAAVRAMSLNLAFLPAAEIAQSSVDLLLSRARLIDETSSSGLDVDAVLGLVGEPKTSLDGAFNTYEAVIKAAELQTKSAGQRASWRKVKLRAINNFKRIVGDAPLQDITRDNALKFYQFWLDRVLDGSHSHDSAKRDVGNMRILYREYFRHVGQSDRPNPFRDLAFKGGQSEKPPPFAPAWIRDRILKPGALDGLNESARGVIYALIETGCRPSEICNLLPECIVLDADVPHIAIKARVGREVKSDPSNRDIPLVGVSLAAFRRWPNGFSDRYGDKENNFSATAMKFFRANGLFPTPRHVIYSFRHAFETRAMEAGIDSELRMRLMGHSIGRPDYGDGGSLAFRRKELLKVAIEPRGDLVL